MKKYVVLACAVMIASTSAFASKARLIALGQRSEGSYYVNDVRNVFLNPASINDHKDTVTMEWGQAKTTTDDSDTTPNTEAGVLHDGGKFVYGVYLGNENTQDNVLRGDLSDRLTPDHALAVDNSLDLFIGGEAGMKWGASLTYSSTENETTDTDQSLMKLKLGAMKNNWGGFLHYVTTNEAEDKGASETFEIDSDMTVGGHYDRGQYRYYGSYRMWEVDGGDEATSLLLGASRVKNLNDKVRLYTALQLARTAVKDIETFTSLNLNLGIEADVKSWLVLRASINQSLYEVIEADNGDEYTVTNTTNVNAGASFVFGDLSIDGLVGTGNNGTNSLTDTDSEVGVLSMDNLLTRVSLTYKY